MKRKKGDFPTSDETRSVLNGSEANVAKIYGCEPSYIFNIKNAHEADPYPVFRDWFQKCAFGGANVSPYLHDLEGIAYQALNGINPTVNLAEKFLSKIDTDAKSTHVLAQTILDNYLDARECEQILEVCDRMKKEETGLREMALNRLNEIKAGRK